MALFGSSGAILAENDNGFDFRGFEVPTTSVNSATAAGFFDSAIYADLPAGTYYVAVAGRDSTIGAYRLRALADTNYSPTVPVLSSDSTATDTLYLDFDGHASSTDIWATNDLDLVTPGVQANGPYTALGFSLDGVAATYSPGERLAIRNLWKVTSEDFSPFNLNVTTVDPGAFNNTTAHRQIITNSDAPIVGFAAGIFGVAYPNTYAASANDNMAFTFAGNFPNFGAGLNGSVMASTVEMGNTSSHEFGHTLGLSHFQSQAGIGSVIPESIMGTPDLGLNREIWASGTDTASLTQDDVSIISNVINTIGYRADDHGDTIASSTLLASVDNAYSSTGVISAITTGTTSQTERDFFRFTASGETTIEVDVDEYITNLDVELRLLNSSGIEIATHDPSNSYDATISQTLPTGTYYIEVRSDSETGTLRETGRYAVAIETQATDALLPTVSISRQTPSTSPTNATSVTFLLDFSEDVQNVGESDFILGVSGLTTGALSVSDAGDADSSTFAVTVSDISGDGTLDLNFATGQNIQDVFENAFDPASGITFEQTYTIDNVAPTADIIDVSPDPRITNAGIVTINFSEAVSGVGIGDFGLTRNGFNVDISSMSVNGSAATYSIDLSSVTAIPGLYVLTLTASGSQIVDSIGNALSGGAIDSWTNIGPQNVTINSTNDSTDANILDGVVADANGLITLRAAIQQANAFGGEWTINLPSATYELSLVGTGPDDVTVGDLDVTANITIIGAGAGSTVIDASGVNDRVFEVRTSGALTLEKLTVTGGNAAGDTRGGGIYNAGQLVVVASTVSNNQAATLGGGIYQAPFNQSELRLINTTVSGNQAANFGGGIFVDATTTNAAGVTIDHSTITNNHAPQRGGGLYVQNSTAKPIVDVAHTILAGNSSNLGPDIFGALTSLNYSLIGASATTLPVGNGNLLNVVDAKLAPLADNGGPTPTHALLFDSPAIDAGNPNFNGEPDFDQRGSGFSRVVGGRIDIGAFELS